MSTTTAPPTLWNQFGHDYITEERDRHEVKQRIRLHVANNFDACVSSPRTNDLIVLVHGWPDCWLTWRHLLPALAERGHRAVAIDLRGFGWTEVDRLVDGEWKSLHSDSSNDNDEDLSEARFFDHEAVCDDLLMLLRYYKHAKAVFLGHDWGGSIIWSMGVCHPEKVIGLVSVCTPYVEPNRDVLQLLRTKPGFSAVHVIESSKDLSSRFNYQLYFLRNLVKASQELASDAAASVRVLLRGTSSTDRRTIKQAVASPGFNFWTQMTTRESIFSGMDVARVERSTMLSPAALDLYVEGFRKSGWRGGLHFYRNLDRNLLFMGSRSEENFRLKMPVFMICGMFDSVLRPSSSDRMFRTVDVLRRCTLGTGHWPHQESVEEFNTLVADWLDFLPQATNAPFAAKL